MTYFIVDAECDGLDGAYLSVAAAVFGGDGREEDCFYAAVKNPTVGQPWVREHVLPYLKNAPIQVESEENLLSEFRRFWQEHREGAVVIADVPHPVESRLFMRAVGSGIGDGPFPLLDLASMLYAKGYPPLVARSELYGKPYDQHDALADVRITAAILFQIIRKK